MSTSTIEHVAHEDFKSSADTYQILTVVERWEGVNGWMVKVEDYCGDQHWVYEDETYPVVDVGGGVL